MADRLVWRRYYARGKRHDHESYGAVCDAHGANHGLAYLRVRDKREGLVYRADPAAIEVLVTQDTYIFSPVLAGEFLIWVEWRRTAWTIRVLHLGNVATGRILEPLACAGRPIHLHAVTAGDRTVLVWEERIGKRTRIRGCRIAGGQFGQPVEMTAGVCNAYDPQCVVLQDGRVGLTYTAFSAGHYRVFIQFFDARLYPLGLPLRVSDEAGAAVYPSICERREGGVWFSFARMSPGMPTETCVKHLRYRAQAGLFVQPMTLAVGALHHEHVYAPLAPPDGEDGRRGFGASMTVFGSEGGARSRVFEDAEGRVRLLFRQHVDRRRVTYEDDDKALVRSNAPGAVEGAHCYAGISLMTLGDLHWSAPVTLLATAHVQTPLSCALAGNTLRFAFTEDGRHTGLNAAGEWMDHESELAVGMAEIALSPGAPPRYDMRPYTVAAVPGEGIADPVRDENAAYGDYTLAFGQLHTHSEVSVCHRGYDRDAHFHYRFQQDVQHGDFGVVTDHAFNMWHTEMLLMRKLATYYYFPGEFVACQSYEWTGSSQRVCAHEGGPWGHVNPLMLGENVDLECYFPGDRNGAGRSLQRLCEVYRSQAVLTPPHHMINAVHPFKWGAFDETMMPVVELVQDRCGSCEKPGAPGVGHAITLEQAPWCDTELLSGKRFGFLGGGDHGGMTRTGIWVRELTREALYEALQARRCFATTGLALTVRFDFNGEPMGSAVAVREGDFQLAVTAPVDIHAVHLVHNGRDDAQLAGHGMRFRHTWHVKRRRHGEFWYCRILLDNGELVWTSPIWID